MNKRLPSIRGRWLLLGVLWLAFALRLYQLEAQSIWWDEGISLNLARSSLLQIFQDRAANIHPPLYFVLLKGWLSLTGLHLFTARYFSVLASFLQVGAVYTVAGRWFGRSRTAVWAAVLLITLSPLSVIYAQEVRVYALLPLVYLGLLILTERVIQAQSGQRSRWLLAGVGVLAWVGLHLHYIVAFALIFCNLWALWSFYRQKNWQVGRRWLAVQALVAVGSLPWLGLVLYNATAVQDLAGTGRYLTDPIPLSFLLKQIWVFHLTGLAGILTRLPVQWLSSLAAGLLLLLALWGLARTGQRRQTFKLAGQWLLPLSSALVVWLVRSFSHPRYVAIFAIGLIPLAAFLMFPVSSNEGARRRSLERAETTVQTILGTAVGLTLGAVFLLGLNYYFIDPTIAKDDMRGVAAYLEATAGQDDLIVVPDAGWAFHFEYEGHTPIVMPGLGQRVQLWQRLNDWTQTPRRIFTLEAAGDSRDWQGVVAFGLEQAGSLTAVTEFDGLILRTYEIADIARQPDLAPVSARLGPLRLTGAWVESMAPQNTAVTLALRWQIAEPTQLRQRVLLRLLDADGWPLARKEQLLLDRNGVPTEAWNVGQEVTTYHILPVPHGVPPLRYSLDVGLFAQDAADNVRVAEVFDASGSPQGQQFALPQPVELASVEDGAENLYLMEPTIPPLPQPRSLTNALSLLAVDLNRRELSAGQSLLVNLVWQANQASLPDLRPRLLLRQGDAVLDEVDDAPALGRYPTNRWRLGERVREHRWLRAPADALEGPAQVILALQDAELVLGEVTIMAEARLFEPPPVSTTLDVTFGDVARLVGYDLPATTIVTGELAPLTLVWESLQTGNDVSYTVFTHMVAEADGRLVGQHDAPPANGARLTTGWVEGEFIVDPHLMQFRETDYTGMVQIGVGLYDPVTDTRLQTDDGRDTVILPVELMVTADE